MTLSRVDGVFEGLFEFCAISTQFFSSCLFVCICVIQVGGEVLGIGGQVPLRRAACFPASGCRVSTEQE